MLKNSALHILYLNARSIVNKIHHLQYFILQKKGIDLIFISETWLIPNILNSMICPDRYDGLKCDRLYGKGGGVLLLYKMHLHVTQFIPDLPELSMTFEFLCVDITCKKFTNRFFCLYIPPA